MAKNTSCKKKTNLQNVLDLYKSVLVPKGEIHFKTDNRGLFEFSLMSFSEYGLLLKYVSLDLHNSGYEGNIMTEYEENFLVRAFLFIVVKCNIKTKQKLLLTQGQFFLVQ